jgi:S1-C subfamily serine protease
LENFKSGGATVSIRASFALAECEVVEEDVRHDIALLKMNQNPFTGGMGAFIKTPGGTIDYPHKVAILSPDRPRDGERIAVSGYPLSNTVLITTSGYLASSWSEETEEIQIPGAPANFRMPDTIDMYLADMHVNPGNSGGPVYSVEHSAVIGVCVSYQTAPVTGSNVGPGAQSLFFNSGLANIVPVRYVIDLLKKHNLKWTQ